MEVFRAMPITVKYFASLREQMGRDQELLQASKARTVGDVWQQVSDGRTLPSNTLCAVNMEYVDNSHPVQEGDEVAFFPPVTGG